MNSVSSDKSLRTGFTTGAAAAAATKAALLYLNITPVEQVEIRCLNNERIWINIHSIKRVSEHCVEAIVIKDGGDDPDVTHNAEIGARVSLYNANIAPCNANLSPCNANLSISNDDSPIIIIRGGEGVGIVTKPGLEVKPGNPAINSCPQKMIREAIRTVLDYPFLEDRPFSEKPSSEKPSSEKPSSEKLSSEKLFAKQLTVDVEIFVPMGKEIAKKTLNSRLGILGGISILGTTGIVTPMSNDAYIATIKSGIAVALATGSDTLVFTTGRRSERSAISFFPHLPEEAFIQIGDFFKASLEAALSSFIKTVIIVVFFGKAVKMAMGFPHTHAAKSELTMKTLVKWAEEITPTTFMGNISSNTLAENIANSNTARHAFAYIYPDFPELISCVGNKIVESANRFSGDRLNIRTIILDFEENKIFDSYN